MWSLLRLALILACLPALTPLSAQETHDWRLSDADQIVSGDYLILTVPMADDDRLSEIAEEVEARYGVQLAAEWPLRSIAAHCLVLDVRAHGDVEGLIARMRADRTIRTVQRMQEFDVFEDPRSELRYDDPLFPFQRALVQLNAENAHNRSIGSGIRIGVVDSGIDRAHPDLSGRLADNRDFVNQRGTDRAEAHGTAMAGVIAAAAANATGIVGVAPGAELVGLRACWQNADTPGRCSSFSLARSLNFAIINGIEVLNLSLGGPPDPLLEELVRDAIAKGIVVVAAWGKAEAPSFPASVPGVIAAGGPRTSGVPAPAIDVISTAPDSSYSYVSGSSVAAAHVSGVVALLLASRRDLTPGDILRALERGRSEQDGRPVLDACRALKSVAYAGTPCAS